MFSLEAFRSPILLKGDEKTAYRDPAACYCNGKFYLYFTLVETEPEGIFEYLAMTSSPDLIHFAPIKKLSPRDQSKNFSSPGNIVAHDGAFYLCCQT